MKKRLLCVLAVAGALFGAYCVGSKATPPAPDITQILAGFIEVDEVNGTVRIGDLNNVNGGGVITVGGGMVELDGGAADGVIVRTTSPNGIELRTGGKVLIPGLPTTEQSPDKLFRNGEQLKISD